MPSATLFPSDRNAILNVSISASSSMEWRFNSISALVWSVSADKLFSSAANLSLPPRLTVRLRRLKSEPTPNKSKSQAYS